MTKEKMPTGDARKKLIKILSKHNDRIRQSLRMPGLHFTEITDQTITALATELRPTGLDVEKMEEIIFNYLEKDEDSDASSAEKASFVTEALADSDIVKPVEVVLPEKKEEQIVCSDCGGFGKYVGVEEERIPCERCNGCGTLGGITKNRRHNETIDAIKNDPANKGVLFKEG